MKDSQKILYIIAALFLALLIIFFAFRVYNFSQQKGESAITKIDQTFTDMEESRYTQYHGEYISGGTVLNFIKD